MSKNQVETKIKSKSDDCQPKNGGMKLLELENELQLPWKRAAMVKFQNYSRSLSTFCNSLCQIGTILQADGKHFFAVLRFP